MRALQRRPVRPVRGRITQPPAERQSATRDGILFQFSKTTDILADEDGNALTTEDGRLIRLEG